jgi:hypothetical protein
MNTVAILGSKGGTGKTSLSHCLAYGAYLHNQDAVMVHTDQRPPIKAKRPYEYVDASINYSQVSTLLKSSESRGGLMVIDGAGNRPHLDIWLARTVDLVLVPVTNSPEDVRCALADLIRMADPRVYAIINKWPSNALVRVVMQRYLEPLPASRVAGRLPEVGATRSFLEDREWQTPPTRVTNLARQAYRLVLNSLLRHRTYPLPGRTSLRQGPNGLRAEGVSRTDRDRPLNQATPLLLR